MAEKSSAQQFDQAWGSLKADRTVQFDFIKTPAEPKPPEWLEAIGRFFEGILRAIGRALQWLFSWMPDAPYARSLLGTLLVIGVALLVWLIVDRLRHDEWRLPWRRREGGAAEAVAGDVAWLPEEMPARAWLEEAEALARQGRFAEAVHCLLLRSVEDMARRRPDAVRPGLTSRELARSALLTERARPLFAGLARTVEDSLFGGHPVGEPRWHEAREAYGSFALPETWRA